MAAALKPVCLDGIYRMMGVRLFAITIYRMVR